MTEGQANEPQDPTILVVDDSQDERDMLAALLRRSGFHFIGTGDPEDALRMAEKSPPAAILTDFRLPGLMNGIELTRRLKQSAVAKHVPIIMLTGMARPQDRHLASLAGVHA